MKKSPVLLVDADIWLYSASCSNSSGFDWGDGVESENINLEGAKQDIREVISDILEKTGCEKMVMCLSSLEKNFRYSILPTYKHTRQGKIKPTMYYTLRQWLVDTYDCKDKPGLEGDDVLGIMSTMSPGKYIIASADKDLKQIPGLLFNWQKDKEPHEVTKMDADWWFYRQVLTGDTCDGYGGCPGIGPKKTDSILSGFGLLWPETENIWSLIVEAYVSKGLTEEDALVQARVARILRAEDYDFKRKEIKLWKPS